MPLKTHAIFLRAQAANYRRSAALFFDKPTGQQLRDIATRCDERADALLATNGLQAERPC